MPPKKDEEEEEHVRPDDMPVAAECVRRQRKKVSAEEQKKEKEEYVSLNWDDIFPKKPMERLRWLYKAFLAAKSGKLKAAPLFDIIAHRKFVEGLKGQIATDTLNLIRGNLTMFSHKQQKQLTSDNFELFRKYAPINVLDSDDDEADAPPLPPPPEVIVDIKEKKKKNQLSEEEKKKRAREAEEEEEGESDDDLDTKRARINARGVERRVDPSDRQAYALDEFIEQYGGSGDRPPIEWVNAKHTSFIFKA